MLVWLPFKEGPDRFPRSYPLSCGQARPSVSCLGCHPTFAHICLSDYSSPCEPAGALCLTQSSQAHNLGRALSQAKRLPAVVGLATRRGTHRLMSVPPRPPARFGIWKLWLLRAAGEKKNDLQNDTYLWQECALEQNKAKISHSNTICKSVYKYASWLNLSSF